MANFPSVLNTFVQVAPTDRLNNPSHSALHNSVSSALGQVEATIGVSGANSVVGTLLYDVRSPGSDGGGHIQTANKGGTGQTAYTKGDLLVAQSASVLAKFAVGANTYVLTADSSQPAGVKWSPAPNADIQTFTVTGVWTKPANAKAVFVTLIGAGGGGATANGNPGGGGGGSGGIANKGFDFPDLLQPSILVTVSSLTAAGAVGATTIFNSPSILAAMGGAPGSGGAGGGGASALSGIYGLAGANGGTGGNDSGAGGGGGGGGGGAAGSAGSNGGNAGGSPGTGGAGGARGVTCSILGYGGNGAAGTAPGGTAPGNPGSIFGGGGGGGTGGGALGASGPGGTGAGGFAQITTFIA